jgi:hypothetical protein
MRPLWPCWVNMTGCDWNKRQSTKLCNLTTRPYSLYKEFNAIHNYSWIMHAVRPTHNPDFSPRRPGSRPGQPMWDLLWAKWHWDRFYSHSIIPLVPHIHLGITRNLQCARYRPQFHRNMVSLHRGKKNNARRCYLTVNKMELLTTELTRALVGKPEESTPLLRKAAIRTRYRACSTCLVSTLPTYLRYILMSTSRPFSVLNMVAFKGLFAPKFWMFSVFFFRRLLSS